MKQLGRVRPNAAAEYVGRELLGLEGEAARQQGKPRLRDLVIDYEIECDWSYREGGNDGPGDWLPAEVVIDAVAKERGGAKLTKPAVRRRLTQTAHKQIVALLKPHPELTRKQCKALVKEKHPDLRMSEIEWRSIYQDAPRKIGRPVR